MDTYLPIGSVVLLRGGKKKIMIYGRKQRTLDTGEEWDYLACPYPEGFLDQKHVYVFNHEQIETVCFLGFHDNEDAALVEKLNSLSDETEAIRSVKEFQ